MSGTTALYLALAILFELGWAVAMKLSQGFSRLGYSSATVVMYLLSVVFLGLATKKLDIGIAYAVWVGGGSVLICVAGMTYFREPVSAVKIFSLVLIVTGIVGLMLSRGGH
ncbi:MAG: DMT family transporter [Phycisphaerales bacterium]